jgi:hypothetical protein
MNKKYSTQQHHPRKTKLISDNPTGNCHKTDLTIRRKSQDWWLPAWEKTHSVKEWANVPNYFHHTWTNRNQITIKLQYVCPGNIVHTDQSYMQMSQLSPETQKVKEPKAWPTNHTINRAKLTVWLTSIGVINSKGFSQLDNLVLLL